MFRRPASGPHAPDLASPISRHGTAVDVERVSQVRSRPVRDPQALGNAAIFLSVTALRSGAERQRIAVMTTAAVLVTLLVRALIGQEILALFGVSDRSGSRAA
ncbi:MAG: MarC family protein [Geminicoccaceae bacterium]